MKKKKALIGKKNYHMERNLTNEVILLLLKEKLHVRAIAKKLKVNHVTVMNRLEELMRENVLDFKQEGKNKVYFLKKTVETRSYVIMAECYKLNMTLKMYPELRNIVKAIQKHSKIRLSLFFGSYAKGAVYEDSDIDIFVETKDRKLKKELELLNSKLSVKIGNYDRSNKVIQEIEKDHVLIKGVELFYEKNKFFE